MHTALKVPSMGVPQRFLKSGCRRSAQQTGWSGGLFSLGPVSGRGGVGEGTTCSTPAAEGWPTGVPQPARPIEREAGAGELIFTVGKRR